MRRRPLACVAPCLCLVCTGCGEPPTPFPDYCDEQRRVIPPNERIIAALEYVTQQRHFDYRLPHFTEFRSSTEKANPDMSDRAISEKYFSAYPACCKVVEPWVVSQYPWFDDAESYHDVFNSHLDFEWSHDVLIDANPSAGAVAFADRPEAVRVQSSSCGEAKFLSVG
jgi:hypothetical protein